MDFIVRLALLVCSFAWGAGLPAAEPIRLRLLTYNIHHGEGVDRRLDLKRIAGVILSVKPDVVALQEVDQNAGRTGGVDQPAELARLTNLNMAFGANIELQGGYYGNVVLSRFPIVHDQNHLLPRLNDGEQRGVLAAEVAVENLDRPLLVLATHFDHRRHPAERVLAAKFVNDLVATDRQRPALLMGDLNDVIGSDSLNHLETTWLRSNEAPLPTIPVANPIRQIDFILVRPAASWRVIETRVLEEAVASDHRAVLCLVEYLPR